MRGLWGHFDVRDAGTAWGASVLLQQPTESDFVDPSSAHSAFRADSQGKWSDSDGVP